MSSARALFRSRSAASPRSSPCRWCRPVILLVPNLPVIERLGLIDTRAGLILVYAAMQVPFTVWVLKNFFDAVPRSLFERRGGDGATRARTLWTIVLRSSLRALGPPRS